MGLVCPAGDISLNSVGNLYFIFSNTVILKTRVLTETAECILKNEFVGTKVTVVMKVDFAYWSYE